jgi:glycosyltransferase involved in cell wall biosynthesis
MISVITVTNRYGGIDINWSGLKRQTFKDFEWILVDTKYEERKEAIKTYTKDERVHHVKQRPKEALARTWLNHAENQGIRESKGELIVFLQDYIHIEPDALEKFWLQYQAEPKCFVSGVGNQYVCPQPTDLKGLITVFDKPYTQRPTTVVWQDPRLRKDLGSFYECRPEDWEVNYAMCPRQMLYDVGGFDEEYDYQGHAFDNCSVAFRGYALGYKPYLDQSNESFSINNDSFSKEKLKTQEDFLRIATFHQQRMKDILDGKHPLKFDYLKIDKNE